LIGVNPHPMKCLSQAWMLHQQSHHDIRDLFAGLCRGSELRSLRRIRNVMNVEVQSAKLGCGVDRAQVIGRSLRIQRDLRLLRRKILRVNLLRFLLQLLQVGAR
jgi:hypothetical protein